MKPPKRKIVSLTITNRCNLNCIYCYEHNKDAQIMSLEMALDIIKQEFHKKDGFKYLEIQFHGGEPFLEFELIKNICEYVWNRKWPKQYIFYITTNGTVFTQEIKDWLTKHKNKIICGLSLDGNKNSQDTNRSNSFDMIDIDYFIKTWPSQGIKMTISNKSINSLYNDIVYMHSLGVKFSCNFAYGMIWGTEEDISLLKKELNKLVEFYVVHPDIEPCSLLNYNLASLFEDNTKLHCGLYKHMIAYDINGQDYPCHMFLENVTSTKQNTDIILSQIKNYNGISNKNCKNCCIDRLCPICHGNSFITYKNISQRDESYCEMIKLTVLATSALIYHRIHKYGVEKFNYNKQTLEAIILIQEKLINNHNI